MAKGSRRKKASNPGTDPYATPLMNRNAVALDELFAMIAKLNQNGIDILGFGGDKTKEPTVIGWMPSAQIYFRDPDGHMLEFITILPGRPNPSFNGPYSEWKKLTMAGISEPA